MVKPRHTQLPKIETVDINNIEFVDDVNANTINVPTVDASTIKNAIINIVPGKKVKVEGKGDTIFSISQKLNNGEVSVLGPEGLILYVKPESLMDVK